MGRKNSSNDTYDNDQDYQQAAQDYAEMGPLWAEMVFPDDFEAMKALYGNRGNDSDRGSSSQSDYDDDYKGRKR